MQPAAAHAGLVALVRMRRGQGFDLGALLDFRHLSRLCSLACRAPACCQRAIELEQHAAELFAATRRLATQEIAYHERRIDSLLDDAAFHLQRRQPCSATS